MYTLLSFLVVGTYCFTGLVLWLRPFREKVMISRMGYTPIWIDLIIFALSPLWLCIDLLFLVVVSPIVLIAGFGFGILVITEETIGFFDRIAYKMRKPPVVQEEQKLCDKYRVHGIEKNLWYDKVNGHLRQIIRQQTLPPNSNVEITLAEGNFGVDLDSVSGLRIIYQSDDLVGAQVSDHNCLIQIVLLPSVIRVALS